MPLTLEELKQRISSEVDETTILELLEIDGEMLVDRFEDEIEARFERLCEEFENPIPDTQGSQE